MKVRLEQVFAYNNVSLMKLYVMFLYFIGIRYPQMVIGVFLFLKDPLLVVLSNLGFGVPLIMSSIVSLVALVKSDNKSKFIPAMVLLLFFMFLLNTVTLGLMTESIVSVKAPSYLSPTTVGGYYYNASMEIISPFQNICRYGHIIEPLNSSTPVILVNLDNTSIRGCISVLTISKYRLDTLLSIVSQLNSILPHTQTIRNISATYSILTVNYYNETPFRINLEANVVKNPNANKLSYYLIDPIAFSQIFLVLLGTLLGFVVDDNLNLGFRRVLAISTLFLPLAATLIGIPSAPNEAFSGNMTQHGIVLTKNISSTSSHLSDLFGKRSVYVVWYKPSNIIYIGKDIPVADLGNITIK